MVCVPKSPQTPSDDQPVRAEVVEVDYAAPGHHAPEVKNASSRVTIAFPFSQIKTQEPSAELAELAALFADLVQALDGVVSGNRLREIHERAQALRARLD
jgi:hypothetical protein